MDLLNIHNCMIMFISNYIYVLYDHLKQLLNKMLSMASCQFDKTIHYTVLYLLSLLSVVNVNFSIIHYAFAWARYFVFVQELCNEIDYIHLCCMCGYFVTVIFD